MFEALVYLTFFVTIGCLAALELAGRKLPASFAAAQAERATELRALGDRRPWLGHLVRSVVFGYLIALLALAFGMPGAKYALLALSIAWTGVSTFNAPNIQHRIAVPFYELSLILNGAVLALAFWR